MRYRPAAAALAAVLALAGCGTADDALSGNEPTSVPETGPDGNHYGLTVMKPVVEGTELLCVKDQSYDSMECNWALWNKTRELTR